MKKIQTAILCVLLTLALLPTTALAQGSYTKDETVYANLNGDGSVAGLYVVNAFESDGGVSVTDYGDYSQVQYLSRSGSPALEDGKVTLDLSEGREYYQGTMADFSLPWSFAITYTLDGSPVSADELAGATGSLEIRIDIAEGAEQYRDFYDNFLVQISYSLDSEKCTDIQSDKANLLAAGSSINVSYTHMQGQSASYVLTCDVRDFELGAISFRAVSRSMPEVDTEPIDELQAQVTELADGVSRLTEAAGLVADASSTFSDGLSTFYTKSTELTAASETMNAAIASLSAAAEEIAEQSQQTAQLAQSLSQSEDPQVRTLAAACLAQTQAIGQLAESIGQLSESYAAFHQGIGALPEQVWKMQSGYDKIDSGIAGVSGGLDTLDGEVSAMPELFEEKVDSLLADYLGGDYEPQSFASPDNRVNSVTFVMKTGEISLPEAEAPVSETAEPVTLWDKLLDLFGLFR